jgi:hypothetical protein
MKAQLVALAGAAATAFACISSPSVAEQKTASQCRQEWKHSKAESLAKGIKRKDYMAQCRQSTAAPTAAALVSPRKRRIRWRWFTRAPALPPVERVPAGLWY